MDKGLTKYQACANLHLNYLDKGFLSSLGLPFLKLLYEAIDKNKHSVLIIEMKGEEVVGFVSGSTRGMKTIYFNLLLKLPSLIIALYPILFSIKKLYKIFEILTISRKSKKLNLLKQIPQEELLSIVVHPDFRGMGFSETLFKKLITYFDKNRIPAFKIIVGESLDRAHSFYLKHGAKPVGEMEVHNGKNSIIYVKKL